MRRIACATVVLALTSATLGGTPQVISRPSAIRIALSPLPDTSRQRPEPVLELEVDDRARKVVSIGRETSAPTVLLMIDSSDRAIAAAFQVARSYSDPRLRLASAIERGFLDGLPPEVRVGVSSFGSRLAFYSGFTTDRKTSIVALKMAVNIPHGERRGLLPIWDAVAEGVNALAAEPGPRSLILFTTGQATGSTNTVDDAAASAIVGSVSVNVVSAAVDLAIPQASQATRQNLVVDSFLVSRPSRSLRLLSDETGGFYLHPPGADQPHRPLLPYEVGIRSSGHPKAAPLWDDPAKGFAELVRSLDKSFRVNFDADGLSPGFHRLRVVDATGRYKVLAPSRLFVD